MKLRPKTKTLITVIAISSLFSTGKIFANSCSNADITFYLQKGFTHDQVVRLCASKSSNTVARPQAQKPAPPTVNSGYVNPPPAKQYNTAREGQVYLEAALKASNVRLTPPILSYSSKECIEYGNKNNSDLNDEACVKSNISINLNGLRVVKATKGLFLIKDVELIVEGNIKREYVNINAIRRQDREAIMSLLPTNPRQINLPVKSGIIPSQVVEKLKPYITP